jgi:hypothetical protein
LNRFQSQVGPRTIITLTSVILTFLRRYSALAWNGKAKHDVAPRLANSLRRSIVILIALIRFAGQLAG